MKTKPSSTEPSPNPASAHTCTITGGRAGFVRAAVEAFKARVHNPTIRYSHARGFHVESGLLPEDADVLWSEAANYILPHGRRSVRPSDWPDVRAAILSNEY